MSTKFQENLLFILIFCLIFIFFISILILTKGNISFFQDLKIELGNALLNLKSAIGDLINFESQIEKRGTTFKEFFGNLKDYLSQFFK